MKFLCPACERLAEIESQRTQGGELFLTCAECHVESSTAPKPKPAEPPAPPAEDAFLVPAGRCPKCIAVRLASAAACPQCGLNFDAGGEFGPPPPVAEAWTRLLGAWGERTAHEKMITAAMVEGTLAAVGRLYRLRLAQAPGDATASWGLEEVVRRASTPSLLGPRSQPPKEASPRAKVIAAVAFLVVSLVVFAILMTKIARTQR